MIRNDMNKIARIVGEHYGVTLAEFRSSERCRRVCRPRQIAMYFCRENITALGKRNSFPEIGRFFGGRDHTTAMAAVKRINILIADDPRFAAKIAHLRECINSEFYDAIPFKSAAQSAIVFNTGAISPPVKSDGRATPLFVPSPFSSVRPFNGLRSNGTGRVTPPALGQCFKSRRQMMKNVTISVPGVTRADPISIKQMEIMGVVVGLFLIHPYMDFEDGEVYRVTHTKSGLRFPWNFPTQKAAKEFALAMASLWDWESVEFLGPKKNGTNTIAKVTNKPTRDIIKKISDIADALKAIRVPS